MTKAGEGKRKIFTSIISVIIVAAAAFGLLKASSILGSRFVTKAIRAGEITLNSREDVNRYFTFLNTEEAAELLRKEREAGQTVFLFPQIDLILNGEPVIVRQTATEAEGKRVSYIVFSGLSTGTKIYSDEASALIGGFAPNFIWFKERADGDPGFARTTLVSASAALSGLFADLGDAYSFFPAGKAIASLNVRAKFAEPVEAQIAVSISDGTRDDYAVFANMLRKNGKFVMLRQ